MSLHNLKTASFLFFLIQICQLFGIYRSLGQTAQDNFGKNRIQYKTFKWSFISSNSTDLFYYPGGENLAKAASEIGEAEFRRISDLFGFTPYNKIKIFLYLSTNDRLMSNVGLGDNAGVTGGKTNFTKSISEVAYEGSILNLRKQIAAGIAQILIRDMLFGGSLKDAVQNSYLLTLPDWFVGGAIRFASEGRSAEMDDLISDISNSRRLRQPANYVGKESYLIGQSIWNYIAEKYGRSSVGNILNLTRIIRNEENAIVGTLGMPFPTFLRDWKNFYQTARNPTNHFQSNPPSHLKTSTNLLNKNYRQLVVSPDGEYLVYSQDRKGMFQVVSYQVRTRKSHVIFRGGSKALHQNSDGEYPILCFSPENRIVLAYPSKGIWRGLSMSTKGKERKKFKIFESFQEIYSMQISSDGKNLVLSGSLDGYSDIFLFNIPGFKMQRFTHDSFDDLDPFFSPGGDTVIFSSNRTLADTLPGSEKAALIDTKRKLTLFSIQKSKPNLPPKSFLSSEGNLIKGRFIPDGRVVCLTDESGISNVAVFNPYSGSSEGTYLTTSKFNIGDYAYDEEHKVLGYTLKIKMKPLLFLDAGYETSLFQPKTPDLSEVEIPKDTASPVPPSRPHFLEDSNRIDIRNYVFEEEKNPAFYTPKIATKGRARTKLKKEPKPQVIELRDPEAYRPSVTANHLTTGLVVNPIPSWGLGALVDFSMHDIFENHHINGGMTYFFTDIEMRNNASFLEYQFLQKRMDFKVRMERKSIQNSSITQFIRQRDILNSISGTISYPISNAFRVDLTPYFQTTRRITFDKNSPMLGGDDVNVNYFGLAGEMVFDNTTVTGMNMITGTRFKLRSQYQAARAYIQKSFGELFMDFRTYQPIHKEITFAFRSTFGSFFGNAPKKYSVGGMDNWMFRSYNVTNEKDDPLRGLNQDNLAVSSDEAQTDWLFNRYSTNLRGFKYNATYGNSFLLFNWELRIPIVRYLYKGPINSNFWRNLQLTAFTDMGTAWSGVGPWNQNNSLNTNEITEGNFQIKVKTFENPFLTGYGAGARTIILGYYAKFDVAWGKQNGLVSGPRYYFTLGYDF